jgi:hypothetical protein
MSHYPLVFRVHAIQRMFQRRISKDEVRQVVVTGETVESYPTDKPFPSRLMLGWSGSRPLHVVAADDVGAEEMIIITVYQPDAEEWEQGFTRRKRR